MKRWLALGAVSLLALAGCSDTTSGGDIDDSTRRPQHVAVFTVDTDSGKLVECIFAKSGYGGGLSCDWN